MLKELSGTDWKRALGLATQDIPPVLILRGTRNLRRHYDLFSSFLSNVREIGSPNGLFEDVCIGTMDSVVVGYASVYGPAMASEIAHVFGLMGTRGNSDGRLWSVGTGPGRR